MRDPELDQLLSPLRVPQCSEHQLLQWQRAVQEEIQRYRTRMQKSRRWVIHQVAACLAIGFFVGFFVGNSKTEPNSSTNSPATIEYIYSNTH